MDNNYDSNINGVQQNNNQGMPAMYQNGYQQVVQPQQMGTNANQIMTDKYFGTQSMEQEHSTMQNTNETKDEIKRPFFAFWNVNGNTYRLKLKTSSINMLERKYKTNLLNLLGSEAGLPALNVMLDITHAAIAPWHNGINISNVETMFDAYVDEGGSQLQFFKEVYLEIFKASGFFTKEMLINLQK